MTAIGVVHYNYALCSNSILAHEARFLAVPSREQIVLVPQHSQALFGRAPKAASRLNLGEALPNSFSERSDSILWSDSLK